MKIEKTFTLSAPQAQVWTFITDPQKVAQCIPGCEGAEEKERGKYAAAINLKVGPIRTTFHLDIEQTEQRPPEFASYLGKGEEGSRASRISSVSTLALKPLSVNSTEVTYTSDINITGRLGKFGGGMMQKIADSIGEEFVAALKGRLESPAVIEAAPGVPGAAPEMPEAAVEVPDAAPGASAVTRRVSEAPGNPEAPGTCEAPGLSEAAGLSGATRASEATLARSEAAPQARREIAFGANWIWWATGIGIGIAALLWWLL
ncbi:MAG TPA: SRPBCC domain-containing protein [Steroidobacteraceae bacterium]|nr:SRPBCC domain-containing protein [Steroidobacteraceae bacterium]